MNIPPQRIRIEDRHFILDRLEEIMDNGKLAYGKYVTEFEERFAEVHHKKYGVSFNSCTSALQVALKSVPTPAHKSVAIPTNTYGATLQACWNAALPYAKLIDIKEDLNMDIDKIEWGQVIGAVIMVFIGGNVPERTQELAEICQEKDIPLLIDAAHSHGVFEATKYGNIQCFSFFATKLMTTMGEGGMLLTDDSEVRDYARAYRHHGRKNTGMEWDHYMAGANMCMTEFQAIVGLSQLHQLGSFIDNRTEVAQIYNEKFDPIYEEGGNWYKYIVRGKPKIKVDDITLSSPVYAKPLHQHSFWYHGYQGHFPVADKVCKDHFCLPIYNNMSFDEATYVMENVDVIE